MTMNGIISICVQIFIFLVQLIHLVKSENDVDVIPSKVTPEGSFLSYNLTSTHQEIPVYYNISIEGINHLLEMKPSLKFIGPSLIIERRKKDKHVREKISKGYTNCHFQGGVKGNDNSFVALSACNGLTGLIKIKNGTYYIQPKHNDQKLITNGHKHKIFKRSTVKMNNTTRKKKKKKKKHHQKNCATKERKKGSRIHWKTILKSKLKEHNFFHKKYKEKTRSSRIKRSLSEPHYIEVLLVADTTMVVFHEEWDLTTYLLTIMNMVSSFYLDPSIGNMIHIVVVKIILIEDALSEPDLVVVSDSDKTLKSFCKWQRKINHKNDTHPHHHDLAILVTRKDICSSSSSGCSTMGIAQVGTICSSEQNCNVNEDNGIVLAHTIAHEIGHNLGMYHDSERKGCHTFTNVQHIMTPIFQADLIGITWSNCSRRDITNFLDKGLGHCLLDKPAEIVEYTHADLPAGAIYDANYQCKLQYSENASQCTSDDEICSRLWCQVNENCITKLLPPAPGTSCGKHRWCQNLQCVDIMDPPAPVDGGWGEWSSWSECSRSCGAGVSISERKCDHPIPSGGGNFCLGRRKKYKICNTEPCEKHMPSFRKTQCAFFNSHLYEGKRYEWLPYFEQNEPCKLYCIDSDNTIIMPFGDYVQDGTPCNVGFRDVCIDGICQKVGCDWVVGSNATEDACGVCRGDNTKCNIFNGTYVKQSISPGYREVVIIPAGAINIKLSENNYSENYISISSGVRKHFYLNGKSHISLPGEYLIAGSTALYEKTPAEKIRIPGPLEEMIVVLVVFMGKTYNPGIHYQYSIVKPELFKEARYNWSHSEWSQCSATCGGGAQQKIPLCKESIESTREYVLEGISTYVDEYNCDPNEKPKEIARTCNDWLCHTHWWIGPWQSCPVTCLTEKEQILRKRNIMCVDDQQMALPDNFCDKRIKPSEYGPCEVLPLCN